MNDKRKEFGSRYLTDESKVFEHNAWDDVEWNEDLESEAKEKVKANSTVTLTEEQLEDYERHAGKHWNDFYCQHQNKFFKDRHWLFTEFHELNGPTNDTESRDNDVTVNTDVPGSQASARIFEVGCGVGNTVFPILQTTDNPNLFVYCCDFAESAIDIVKEHELYNPERCHAFVCDVTDKSAKLPVPECSLDFIVLIFVLSAVRPDRMLPTLQRLTKLLKPGGMFLFRDYGQYDMAQLRFKPGKCLQENFYARGDGTRVYFFTQDETDELFTKCGLVKVENMVDRRLQVNRGRQLKMYRVWVQCKYMRPK